MVYLIHNNVQVEHCNHRHIVPFLELLRASNVRYQSILNHMSGLKLWLYRSNVHAEVVSHPLVSQMRIPCSAYDQFCTPGLSIAARQGLCITISLGIPWVLQNL